MTSDGTPWRPLVHGLDIARAIIAVLQAPTEAIHNEVFNVGDTSHNYRVREIAEVVGEVFPDCRVSFGAPGQDNRSYRVSFEKIRKHLPGFRCAWDARRGAKQLYDLFKRIDMTKDVFECRTFTRLKQLEYLIRTQQIDPQFFWTSEVGGVVLDGGNRAHMGELSRPRRVQTECSRQVIRECEGPYTRAAIVARSGNEDRGQ